MDPHEPSPSSPAPEMTEDPTCYGHPETPTKLRCTRCDKPICGRCAVPASVGQHCVWCVAEAKKNAPKVRSTLQATSPAVRAIIVINVGIWVLQSFFIPTLTMRFSAHPFSIAAGEWWRLMTAMFLHAPFTGALFSVLHVGFNAYVLRIFGPDVEQTYGTKRFVPLYLVAGFGGSAVSYATSSCLSPGSIGASGAVFGVVGVLLAYLYRRRTSDFVVAQMRNLMFFIGINLFIGFTIPRIDNAGHIGGLLAGLLIGALAGDPRLVRNSTTRYLLAVGITFAVSLALVIWRTTTFSC